MIMVNDIHGAMSYSESKKRDTVQLLILFFSLRKADDCERRQHIYQEET